MTSGPTEAVSVTSASTLVRAPARLTYDAVLSLSGELWDVRVLHAVGGREIVQAVSGSGDEADCWLTWSLSAVSRCATRVTLTHCEQAGRGPAVELDVVLLMLLARCATGTTIS